MSRHVFRSIDANAPPPPEYPTRPDPALGQNDEFQSEGVQTGNALELTFRGRLARYFNGQAQYRLSKTYNNTGGISARGKYLVANGGNFFPANSYDPKAEWARSDMDQRNQLNLLGTVTAGPDGSRAGARAIFRAPYDVTTGADNNHDGVFTTGRLAFHATPDTVQAMPIWT